MLRYSRVTQESKRGKVMKVSKTIKNLFAKKTRVKDEQGWILIVVISLMSLVVMSVTALSAMVQRDVNLIRTIKENEQARFLAEAGITHAFAKIIDTGFAARSNFSDSLDTGSYSVTYSETGGRYLVTSQGTVSGVTKTVTAEIYDNTPTALNYFSGAGNDIRILSLIAGADIVGDIHANDDVFLRSGFLISWLNITGDVSATDIVVEGSRHNTGSWDWWDNHVVINGQSNDSATVYEGADWITFPTFNYSNYQQEAIDSGDYYSSSQTFNNQTLSPGNGIVYVDGDATFTGTCTLNGGIIADEIIVLGTFLQEKVGTRNVIIAKVGDIRVFGRFYTEEALVFATQDIASLQILAEIEINGILLAKRDSVMWNFITLIDYNYVYLSPSDMLGEDGEDVFKVTSWNK